MYARVMNFFWTLVIMVMAYIGLAYVNPEVAAQIQDSVNTGLQSLANYATSL